MPDAARRLAVLVEHELCGTITEGPGLAYDFSYTQDWIGHGRPALSLALPSDGSAISQEHARAYFGGLLPEGGARRQVAEREGIDELDDIALLSLLGRECAGAIAIVPFADDGSFDADRGPRSAQWLNDTELTQLITSLRVAGSDDPVDRYSVSLAGAQLKRGVLVDIDDGRIGIPIGDELSSHILKLEPANYPGMSAVEHCMQHLASDIELRASSTALRRVGDEPVLLVERFDRAPSTSAGHPVRLHQEDMCQALGRLSSQKYERYENGVAKGPTIVEMVELLRRHARPSVQQVDDFLRLLWFNVIIGNVDAHSKNYSLLYHRDMRRFRIAPLYDAICVSAFHAHEERDKRHAEEPIAMNIGGQTMFWQLGRDDIAAFANSLRIAPRFVFRQVDKIAATVERAIDDRVALHQSDDTTAHDLLETTRIELHERCEFIRGIVG
jgi:serine/threonine-protein kinase HipA